MRLSVSFGVDICRLMYIFLLCVRCSVLSAVSGVKVKISQLHDSKSSKLLSFPSANILSIQNIIKTRYGLSCRLCCYNLMYHFGGTFLHSASWYA